ncbi:MAG TPA: tetratricopeptide repeat protein [Candidatus Limnocylindrales bacterium]
MAVRVDPAAKLLAELCHDLRSLRAQAGGPSLRALADQIGLGKSQVGAILSGRIRALPDWSVVRGLVESSYKYAHDNGRIDKLAQRLGLDEYWRPRYALLEHAFSQPRSPEPPSPDGAGLLVVPRQLPRPVKHFVGRRSEMDSLTGVSGPVVISGVAGVGKTALAVWWAHDVAENFPDGQLYVNLRGFDPSGSTMTAGEAVLGFLDAFGVPPWQVPAGEDAQIGLYRSLLAQRRILVLLDNARDAEQVRPLLPGSNGCLAVVTSRGPLAGLVITEGAQSLRLDQLSTGESADLLAVRIGADRLAADPVATKHLVAAAARLPLALCVVAGRAALQPKLSLAALVEEICGEREENARSALDAFQAGDSAADVRAVFSWSYHTLGSDAARLFRLLSLHPGEDFALPAVASLAGVGAARTRSALAELTAAGLLSEPDPGRHGFHDLLRAYASELAHETDTEDDRKAALHRLFDHYLHTAYLGAVQEHPLVTRIDLAPVRSGVKPEAFADASAAQNWFDDERLVLLAAVSHAARAGFTRHAWQLALAIAGYLERQGLWQDWHTVQVLALDAASRDGHRTGQAQAHRHLARVCSRLRRPDDARAHLALALDLFDSIGDRNGLAHTHMNLGQVLEREGHHREALGHSRQALDMFTEVGSPAGRAYTLNAVGWQLALLGEYQAAIDSCEQALDGLRTVGDRQGEADTWDSLGYAHHQLGDHRRAIACFGQALGLFTETGDRYSEASTLDHLGESHQAAGEPIAARAAWRKALPILRQLGHPDADRVLDRLRKTGPSIVGE